MFRFRLLIPDIQNERLSQHRGVEPFEVTRSSAVVLSWGCGRMGLTNWGENMSGEIIAILGVGVALAGLILNGQRGLRADIAGLRGEIAEIRAEIAQLRERMAHLEGLLEGLREAITGRVKAG